VNIQFFNTAFSNPALLKAIENSGLFQPEFLLDKEGTLWMSGFLFRKIVNFRLLLFEENFLQLGTYDIQLRKFLKSAVFTEFRPLNRISVKEENLLNQLGFSKTDWLNLIVKTNSVSEIWEKVSDVKKRQIRSSEKYIKVEEAGSEDDVDAFYKILFKLYRQKVRKPLPHYNFFSGFYHHVCGTGYGTILTVKHQDKVIAGMLCSITPGKSMYEWYVVGMDDEYKGKGIYPSVMITWAALEYACNHKIPQFNFMGAGYPEIPYGVRDFKLDFGGELVNVGRYIKSNKPFLFQLGKMYILAREIM